MLLFLNAGQDITHPLRAIGALVAEVSFLGCVCKINIACHSEERSDEESLLLPKVSLFRAEPRPFAEFTLSEANVLRVT